MTHNGMQRKLRAIFSADVKGYSKLMGDDDEFTINTITSYREIIIEMIQRYHGRVVDSPGDNILAEFSGSEDRARKAARQVLRVNPQFSTGYLEKLALLEEEELGEKTV